MDSAGSAGWHGLNEVPHVLMTCETLGWLVKEDSEMVTVALNGVFNEASNSRLPWGELISIPKCSIKKRRRVLLP